jgi:hypothetical protein
MDHEWEFDANSLTLHHSASPVYAAFYSDLEPEVLKVTSGRSVTVTYNLYLVDPTSNLRASSLTSNVKSVSNLQSTLRRLLRSPESLPDGGALGFGLVHLYPVNFNTKLQSITNYLKGEDAHVYRTCRELQLEPPLRIIYDDNESGSEYGIMLDEMVQDPDYHYEVQTYECALMDMGGISVNKTESVTVNRSRWVSEGESEGGHIIWISPFNQTERGPSWTDVGITTVGLMGGAYITVNRGSRKWSVGCSFRSSRPKP